MTCFAKRGLLLLIAVLASSGGLAAAPAKKAPAGIPNFHEVAPGIYRGAAPTRAGLEALAKMGVRTIIDLRIEKQAKRDEKPMAEKLGFTWIHLPMGREAPTRRQVQTFLAALARAPGEPVFVHCQHGADRTGAMVGIYRVQVQKWSFARAWAEMRKYGFKPYLHELKAAVRSRARS